MNDAILRSLMERIDKLERERVRYRQGVVTDDDPLSVAVGGAATPYTGVDSLAGPASLRAGDNVGALTWGNSMLVLGALTSMAGVRVSAFTGSTTITTASSTFAAMTGLTTGTRAWSGRPVLVAWSAELFHSVSGGFVSTLCALDGTVRGVPAGINAPAASTTANVAAFALLTPSAGSHTLDIRWATNTATASAANRTMIVVEF